ncbi:protein AMEIOTIC 1 homolog [Oryza brachyantha]|uniref:PTC1-like winged helix-turn-helix domain-containing protein n=1 Tax=Oryza brachyantha TaxID=4533 RepID=J3NF51_ORYBR|nr:protein AMEIOTIC 1 homolog [Oryza brachyantha]
MSATAVYASRVMRHRAAGEDLGARRDDDGDGAFWAGGAPRLYDFSQQREQEQKPPPLPVSPAPVPPSPEPTSPVSAAVESVAPCLLTLQCSGVGWGVRKRVRYVGRHLGRHALVGLPAGERAVAAQEDEESSTKAGKKEKSPELEQQEAAEEEENCKDDHKATITTDKKKRRRSRGGHRGRGRSKRPKKGEEDKTLQAPKSEKLEEEEEERPAAASGMVDRWKATRYATAEASLLAILRAHGARAGNAIPRGELRKEARKHIGDTGLLDHLLRHIADKLAPGRADRFRRRHNADGGMVYWLEPAELFAVRREAGVADPYWVPPPGWKLGDPVSPEAYALEAKKQVEQLAAELAGVKRHMEQLTSNVMQVSKGMKSEAEKSHNSWQDKYTCMVKANSNLEKQLLSLEEKYENVRQANGDLEEELLFLKEKYVSVFENNIRLEQQMSALSTSFLSLKEDLLWVNAEEQHMLEKEDDLFVKEPWEEDKQEGDATTVVAAAANQLAVDGDGTTTSSNGTEGRGGSGKRTSRKCSVRISKPQGTFQWPSLPFSAPPSPPLTPTADIASAGANSLANFATMDELCEFMMAGGLPTPPSASSTTNNAGAGKLPAPACTSPVKTAALDAGAGGGNVGTELALATPTY